MSYIDVTMKGWNKVSLCFTVWGKQKMGDVEVFQCKDHEGNEFFIESSEVFEKYTRNSSSYSKEEEVNLGDIIQKLQHTNSVYEVKFMTIENEERTLRGYTIGPDENFGYTLAQDLDAKGPRRINNRGILSLILNNTKYTVK